MTSMGDLMIKATKQPTSQAFGEHDITVEFQVSTSDSSEDPAFPHYDVLGTIYQFDEDGEREQIGTSHAFYMPYCTSATHLLDTADAHSHDAYSLVHNTIDAGAFEEVGPYPWLLPLSIQIDEPMRGRLGSYYAMAELLMFLHTYTAGLVVISASPLGGADLSKDELQEATAKLIRHWEAFGFEHIGGNAPPDILCQNAQLLWPEQSWMSRYLRASQKRLAVV